MFELNLLNFIFVNFVILIVIFGSLINFIEPYLPTIISQSFRYGKISHKGEKSSLAELLEMPKSSFRHFYVFALFWSCLATYLSLKCYVLDTNSSGPPELVLQFLDFVTGTRHRRVQVGSTAALIAVCLITLQCCRRFFETHFVQIFSSHSRINLSHYIFAFLHYFGAITAILANAQGFVRGSKPQPPSLFDLNIIHLGAIGLFLYSWVNQFFSNLILVNLRKNKTGKVVTEQHLMPVGGWFESVSSPHMLFEVLMYVALAGLMPGSVTYRYVAIFVLANQTETAWLTHKWYKEIFSTEYPKNRKAILPGIL